MLNLLKKIWAPKLKIYKSFEFLPIYNFEKLYNSNDIRYLQICDLRNGTPPPEISNNKKVELFEIWSNILLQLEDINIISYRLYYECWRTLAVWIANKTPISEKELNEAWAKYTDWLQKEFPKYNLVDAYIQVKAENETDILLYQNRLIDFNFSNFEQEKTQSFDLLSIIISIKKNFQIDIDKFTDPTKEFFRLKKMI